MSRIFVYIFCILAIFFIIGCGGGSGSNSISPSTSPAYSSYSMPLDFSPLLQTAVKSLSTQKEAIQKSLGKSTSAVPFNESVQKILLKIQKKDATPFLEKEYLRSASGQIQTTDLITFTLGYEYMITVTVFDSQNKALANGTQTLSLLEKPVITPKIIIQLEEIPYCSVDARIWPEGTSENPARILSGQNAFFYSAKDSGDIYYRINNGAEMMLEAVPVVLPSQIPDASNTMALSLSGRTGELLEISFYGKDYRGLAEEPKKNFFRFVEISGFIPAVSRGHGPVMTNTLVGVAQVYENVHALRH